MLIVAAPIQANWSTFQQTSWDIMLMLTASPSILICSRRPNKNFHVPISQCPMTNSLSSPQPQSSPSSTSHVLPMNGKPSHAPIKLGRCGKRIIVQLIWLANNKCLQQVKTVGAANAVSTLDDATMLADTFTTRLNALQGRYLSR
jgi:hypothetical protein